MVLLVEENPTRRWFVPKKHSEKNRSSIQQYLLCLLVSRRTAPQEGQATMVRFLKNPKKTPPEEPNNVVSSSIQQEMVLFLKNRSFIQQRTIFFFFV